MDRHRTQPGVASAIDPTELVREVQQVRRTADTVIVYVHWGTETQACPNPQQEPLAQQLVKAGADIVIGADAHVLLGGGYLGSAYVDYGLGNFAFYDTRPPETDSGSLIITAEGRHVTRVVFRPATIVTGLPQPLTRRAGHGRGHPELERRPRLHQPVGRHRRRAWPPLHGETVPFVAPPASATTTTTTTATGSSGAGSGGTAATTATTTTTATSRSTTTTAPRSTTTSPTDNAGSG